MGGALQDDLLQHGLGLPLARRLRIGLAQYGEVAAVGVVDERADCVGFVRHGFEGLQPRGAARLPELLDGQRGALAQRIPGRHGEVGERTGGLRHDRQIDQPGGCQADQAAIHVACEVDCGARA